MAASLRPWFNTIACAAVTFFLCQRYLGALVLMLLPLLAVGFLLAAIRPGQRWLQLRRFGLWMLGVAVVLAVHGYRSTTDRRNATEIVGAIEAYVEKHGSCPRQLELIGIAKARLRAQLGLTRYSCDSQGPYFSYSSTFMMIEYDAYDFGRREWAHFD